MCTALCSAISSGLIRRWSRLALFLAVALPLLGACAGVPALNNAGGYPELMESADEAHRKGGVVEAMSLYEKAAKADPSKKQPWLRMAQAQFDARNYGSAINAAQEVLLRDTTDTTAKSIMAVSGLRVSATALDQLRLANAVEGNTREEAQTLARIMREALGESILPSTTPASPPPERAAPRPAMPVRRVTTPAVPAAAPLPAAEPKRNPFDALKG